VYFYELHEGDDDLMSDVILACEDEVSPVEFLSLVETARAAVEERFEEDTLTEAIAAELERSHGFVHVNDARLVAAVRVASDPADDRLVGAGEEMHDADEDEDEDDDSELAEQVDYLTILADLEPGAPTN
jgi:hypothetical protein